MMKVHTKTVVDMETMRVVDDTFHYYDGPIALAKQTQAEKEGDAATAAKIKAGLAAAGPLGASARGIQNTLLPAYQQMLKGPSPAETLTTVGGIGASAGAAREALARRAAATNNPAGYTAGLDKLAQSQMISTADAMAKLSTEDRNRALAGLSSLYGVDTETMTRLLTPGAWAPPSKGGFGISGGIPGVAEVGYHT